MLHCQALAELCSCPLAHTPLRQPLIGTDGMTYSSASIERWLLDRASSPFTRVPMTRSSLVLNRLAAELLDLFERTWPGVLLHQALGSETREGVLERAGGATKTGV